MKNKGLTRADIEELLTGDANERSIRTAARVSNLSEQAIEELKQKIIAKKNLLLNKK
jgi:DNA-binding transcriptional MerR regulator